VKSDHMICIIPGFIVLCKSILAKLKNEREKYSKYKFNQCLFVHQSSFLLRCFARILFSSLENHVLSNSWISIEKEEKTFAKVIVGVLNY